VSNRQLRKGSRVRCLSRVYDRGLPLFMFANKGEVGKVERVVSQVWDGHEICRVAHVSFGAMLAVINVNALERV
jgi:hypothetical protein